MMNRPLSICLISEEFPPETGWGGIGSYSYNLARGLAELGHRVHVIARCWGERRTETIHGVQLHRIPIAEPSWRRGTWFINTQFPSTREMLLWSVEVSRVIETIRSIEGLDIIESPEYHAQGLITSLRDDVTPLVVRLHTPTYLCRQVNGVAFGGSRWDTVLSEQAERWMTRRAQMVTSPSRALARDVAKHWRIGPEQVRVIPNPIDEQFFSPDPVGGQGSVLFVGRLERRKGIQTLIDAVPEIVAAVPDARVELVGNDHDSAPDGGSMRAHFKKSLESTAVLAQAVLFRGALDRTALPDVYRAAKLCVVPSLYENFPYTALEAMACGCAVVASRVGGIPEIISDGVDGLLVDAGDASALSRAIVRLLQDDQLRRRLGSRARETICRQFSRHAITLQTLEAYHELLIRGSGFQNGRFNMLRQCN